MSLLRHIWTFRELLVALVQREIASRYRGSLFGRLWVLLQPLAFLGIYIVVFVQWFRQNDRVFGDEPAAFPLAMLAGLVPWLTVSEVVTGGSGLVPRSGSLIRRYAFPTEVLPVHVVMAGMFSCVVNLLVFAVLVFAFMGRIPHHAWLLPILLAALAVYLLGLVYLISALSVYVKDIPNILPMLMTVWFFLSPIFLFAKAPVQSGSELTATVLSFNPLTYLIGPMRDIFLWRREDFAHIEAMKVTDPTEYANIMKTMAFSVTAPGDPPIGETLIFAAIAAVTFALGYAVFMRLKPGFADEI